MDKITEDLYILAKIYLGILNDAQAKSLFGMLDNTRRVFIPGTMPLGQAFYYNYESFFGDSCGDVFTVKNDKLAIPIFIIEVSKKFLKEKMKDGYNH